MSTCLCSLPEYGELYLCCAVVGGKLYTLCVCCYCWLIMLSNVVVIITIPKG